MVLAADTLAGQGQGRPGHANHMLRQAKTKVMVALRRSRAEVPFTCRLMGRIAACLRRFWTRALLVVSSCRFSCHAQPCPPRRRARWSRDWQWLYSGVTLDCIFSRAMIRGRQPTTRRMGNLSLPFITESGHSCRFDELPTLMHVHGNNHDPSHTTLRSSNGDVCHWLVS